MAKGRDPERRVKPGRPSRALYRSRGGITHGSVNQDKTGASEGKISGKGTSADTRDLERSHGPNDCHSCYFTACASSSL